MEELAITDDLLNTSRMQDLMAVRGKEMPLYMYIVSRVLREMRIEQQKSGLAFEYNEFKRRMERQGLTVSQMVPFLQRLEVLESFMPKPTKKKGKKKTPKGNCWTPKVSFATSFRPHAS